jgi:hypothetical protein
MAYETMNFSNRITIILPENVSGGFVTREFCTIQYITRPCTVTVQYATLY